MRIHGWDIREGVDSTDDPGVWVWAVIDEQDFKREVSLEIIDTVRAALLSAAPHLPTSSSVACMRRLPPPDPRPRRPAD